MNEQTKGKLIIVTGDITMDWNIAHIRRLGSLTHLWHADDLACAFCEPGGAAMLGNPIEAVAQKLSDSEVGHFRVRKPNIPRGQISPAV